MNEIAPAADEKKTDLAAPLQTRPLVAPRLWTIFSAAIHPFGFKKVLSEAFLSRILSVAELKFPFRFLCLIFN
jgi:hypothetical protein